MSTPVDTSSFVLVRRVPEGSIEWLPLVEAPGRIAATPGADYTLIERVNYEAPQALQVERDGNDLIVEVGGARVLVLEGFFVVADASFYPTSDIAGGAGAFSGTAITPASPPIAESAGGEQVVWSAAPGSNQGEEPASGNAGGTSALPWIGAGVGVLGVAALAGGGGGSGGGGEDSGSGGGGPPPPPPPASDTTPPQITSGPTATAVTENSGAGKVVYTATATDSATVTYSLKSVGDAAAFSIDASTGAVTLTSNPDFEAKSSYTFTVVARDVAGNTAEQVVSLAITDVADSTPPPPPPSSVTITSGTTATPIDENSGSGRVIYTATATADGPITYSLKSGADAASFTINPSTGAVALTSNPDHEVKSSYQFTVVATSGRSSAERAVTLTINDLDEAAPTITSSATAPAVDENSGAGRVVYTVTSTDTGDVSRGSTTYSLAAGADAGAFSINGSTGAVTLTADPDHETKSSYQFTVVATDAAGNRSQRVISLAVNDLDEVAPTITSPSTASTIAENTGAGQLVYTVTSTDTGDISTGSTTYSLQSGGDADFFSIDGSTGAVTLTGSPDFETKSSYNFTVVATDQAGNSTTRAVSLQILDIDDDGGGGDTTRPTLTATSPESDDQDVPVGTNIVLTFSESVRAGGGVIHIRDAGDNREIDPSDATQVTIEGNRVTINPADDLNADGNYSVRIDRDAFVDVAGNPLDGENEIEFRTVAEDDGDDGDDDDEGDAAAASLASLAADAWEATDELDTTARIEVFDAPTDPFDAGADLTGATEIILPVAVTSQGLA